MTSCDGLTSIESQISILVWEGLTNREIGKIVGTSEQEINNHFHSAFVQTWGLESVGTSVCFRQGCVVQARLLHCLLVCDEKTGQLFPCLSARLRL
jgi:hypothetical protein